MIKRMRKEFIAIALSVVAAVIIVIVAGIDVANYLDMKSDADKIITVVSENLRDSAEEALSEPIDEPRGDLPGGFHGEKGEKEWTLPKDMPREIAFSARYFVVHTDDAGKVTDSELDRIAMVSEADLQKLVDDASKEKGFVGNYRYQRVRTETGYRYLFLDCEKEITACRTFTVSSVIITSVGLAVIALFVILLSKKALAPVEESYKKQKRFITDAGHELKTPLTVISANTELLELDVGEDNEWLRDRKSVV